MRTKITLHGEIASIIWTPAVECSKESHLEIIRIPRTSATRTHPGIAPRSTEITCLRDALLHLTNDVDFQSCSINWQGWRFRITSGTKRAVHEPLRSALACGNCAVRVKTQTVSPRCTHELHSMSEQ
jgi:hypothetical protein